MKVKDIIKDLTDLDEVWVKGKIERLDGSDYHLVIAFNNRRCFFSKNDEIELGKSVGDKVEVPSCMGIFLDRYRDKEETAMHIIMHDFTKSEYFLEFAGIPLADYPMGWDRLMASALMFGYAVKPKRWVVKKSADRYFKAFNGIDFRPSLVIYEDHPCLFTDRKKAEAVALLIDGEVEEAKEAIFKQSQLTDDQQQVLGWLKEYYKENRPFTTAFGAIRSIVSKRWAFTKQNLTEDQQEYVLEAFSRWAQEQEEAE